MKSFEFFFPQKIQKNISWWVCSELFFWFTLQTCHVWSSLLLFCFFPCELTKVHLYRLPLISEICPCYLSIARDNLMFLKKWLDKFPQYRNRSLFITGESYAGMIILFPVKITNLLSIIDIITDGGTDTFKLLLGHYVPQLAELMLQFNKEYHFNLKGIAVSCKIEIPKFQTFCSLLISTLWSKFFVFIAVG